MKLTNEEPNYCATVVEIKSLHDVGLDTLQALPVFGFNALVGKDHKEGELGIAFTAESQLSEDFCYHNDLNTDASLNKSTTEEAPVKGYVSKRRIRAIKLGGQMSSALWIPLSALDYLDIDTSKLKDGDMFTHINGTEIVKKYIPRSNQSGDGPKNKIKGKNKRFVRIDNKMFPEHLDTEQYFKNLGRLKDEDCIIVTNKTHGTSGRFANLSVRRKLSTIERWLKWFGVKVQEEEYDTIAGSRRVVKDTKAEKINNNYYGDGEHNDVWNLHLKEIGHLIPKDWIIYGEIVGWTAGGSAIQKGYTYSLPQGKSKLFVYRISTINSDGLTVDLSWDVLVKFCKENGIETVQELWRGKHKDFEPEKYIDKRYYDEGWIHCPQLENKKLVDEGCVIRLEGATPYLLK